jgi:hypothetical protein
MRFPGKPLPDEAGVRGVGFFCIVDLVNHAPLPREFVDEPWEGLQV